MSSPVRLVWHLYHGVTLPVLYRCRILHRQLWHFKENTEKAVCLFCRKWNSNVCGDNVLDVIYPWALQIFYNLHKHPMHKYGTWCVYFFQISWFGEISCHCPSESCKCSPLQYLSLGIYLIQGAGFTIIGHLHICDGNMLLKFLLMYLLCVTSVWMMKHIPIIKRII